MFKSFLNLYWLKPSGDLQTYELLIRGVGLIYVVAAIPLLWQIDILIGANGLLPANELLKKAYSVEQTKAFVHFPSLYWLCPSNIFLLLLCAVCCFAGIWLVFAKSHLLIAALLAWVAFVSVTVVGGDFSVIIIDLFLAEVGFLAVLVAASIEKGYVPYILDFAFKLLNFRLWLSMGMVKFYWGLDNTWGHFTFFENFFPFQPIPTPGAWCLWQCPAWLHSLAIVCVFIGQIIAPFAQWCGRRGRLLAFTAYLSMSVLIIISGNYGYFNWLSIVLAITVLKDSDVPWLGKSIVPNHSNRVWLVGMVALFLVGVQFLYLLFLFDRQPPHAQNHFNYPFFYKGAGQLPVGVKQVNDYVLKPMAWLRLSNPYGVFKDIPHYRAELRFSGSVDGTHWKPVVWRYHPSALNNRLRWVAPYYPRLDHLLFYESIDAGNYRFNPLNPYSVSGNVWTCRFIAQLKDNNSPVASLLKEVPKFGSEPMRYVKVDVYSLTFNQERAGWNEAFFKTVYNDFDSVTSCTCRPLMEGEKPLLTYE